MDRDDAREGLEVAVIGMTCRFPGANNIHEFWNNLRDGKESIKLYTDEELNALGVEAAALKHPSFVKAGSTIPDIDQFDAAFFGYSPKRGRAPRSSTPDLP